MRAWKIIEVQYADAASKGRLRIGTLSDFANLENGRADEADGALSVRGISGNFDANGADRAFLSRIGMKFQPGATLLNPVVMTDCSFVETPLPMWAFCMSEEGCDYDTQPSKKKAIFEISDVHELALAIGRTHPDIGGFSAEKVDYRPTVIGQFEALARQGSPFVKDVRYCNEREIRITFGPKRDGLIKPFFTPEIDGIAKLLRRVR